MASSSSSDDESEKILLSNLLNKSRDDLLINTEKFLIDNDLPIWDRKSNSKLQFWIKNISTRLDVSLSINILKLMTCYVMGQDKYDEKVVMEIYLNMLSMSNRVADCISTERYTKISFWESITEFNMAVLDFNDDLIAKEFLVIGIQFISIVVTPGADHFLRQLYIKSLNNLLEKYSQLARGPFKQQAHEHLECLPMCLAEVGDYDFQTSIVELIFRTTGISERKANINKIFPGLDLTIQSLFLRIHDFDPDCRHFLNKYNASLGDNQLVFTFPCHNAQIGQLKLNKPKSSSYEKFWVDFNLRSGTILIMCDRSSNGDSENRSSESTWESLVLYPNEVSSVQLSLLPHTTTLVVELGRDPAEIFASPPSEEDLALLSEWISIEFGPNRDLKTVCRKMYSEKISVHDMTPHNSYPKVSKSTVAVASKALSSSEAEVHVPIPVVGTDSSSGNALWNSSAVEHITTTTKNTAKKVPRKKISKTCIPIQCADHSESNTATSGVTDEEKRGSNIETNNLFEDIPQSNIQIEASTSIESNKYDSQGTIGEVAKRPSDFTKNVTDDSEAKQVSESKLSKIKKSPLKIKDAAEKVVNDHITEDSYMGDYKDKEKGVMKKEKELSKKESPLKMKESAKKSTNDSENFTGKKKKQSEVEMSPLRIKDSVKKDDDHGKRETKKYQKGKQDSAQPDNVSVSHTTKDRDDKLITNTGGSTIDETKVIENEFEFGTEINENIDMFMNDTTLVYPKTPTRNENDKVRKSPILGGNNSLNKLSEMISSVSPERKISKCFSLEDECDYTMPTQDQGILLEAMDTLDNIDENKDNMDSNKDSTDKIPDLSSTEVKLQNSEDEVEVDIESEEEIPSSIATPSATTPLFKLKMNMELTKSKSNRTEGECDNNKCNDDKEVSKESCITSPKAKLDLEVENNFKSTTNSNNISEIYEETANEKCSEGKTVHKIEKGILTDEGKGGCKNVEEFKSHDKVSPNKSIDEKVLKLETTKKINDTISEKSTSQSKDDNQLPEIVSSSRNQQEESNIDFDGDIFTKSEDTSTLQETDKIVLPSKVKEISQNDSNTTTEKIFVVIEEMNSPLRSCKSLSPSKSKSSSPNKVLNKSELNYSNKDEKESLKLSAKLPQSGLAIKNNKSGSPSRALNESPMKKNIEYKQENTSLVTKSPQSSADIHEQENLCSPLKSQKCGPPLKKSKSEPFKKTVYTSPIKDNKQDHSQVFKPALRSRKCKSTSKEPAKGSKFKDLSSLTPKSTKKTLLIKNKSSSQEPDMNSPSDKPAMNTPSEELSIKSPVKDFDGFSDLGFSPKGPKFKDFSSLVSSPKSTKKKNLLIKTQPKTRASSSSRMSVAASPKKEKNSYKAVVKVIESPKLVVELTKLPIAEVTKLTSTSKIKEEKKRTKSISESLLLEKSIREDSDIVHVTSSFLSPITDLAKKEKDDTENPCSVDGVHNILMKKNLHAEIGNSFIDIVRSSYSGKETILRYSKDINVLDQITTSEGNKDHKKKRDLGDEDLMIDEEPIDTSQSKVKSTRKKRGLSDEDLMIHEEPSDTSQPKNKSPRKEDDKLNKTDKNVSEGYKSAMKILETYGSNVHGNKLGRKTPRKDEITPVQDSKAKMSNEPITTRNKRNKSSPAINVTPNNTSGVTPSNHHSEFKKSKKKLFNNTDLNILQDTPPSSQSPDVEVASLYQRFNSETKPSGKRNSSKNVSKNSTDKSTKDLSVYSTYLESPTHHADEKCDTLESNDFTKLNQSSNKTRTSMRIKKENTGKKSAVESAPMKALKKKLGRPKKASITVYRQERKSRFLASPDIDSPIIKDNSYDSQRRSIYSDFSSEDEFGWLKKKEKEPRVKATRGYSKANWSYRRSQETSSPEWRPVREKGKKKRVELPKAPTPPQSYHSTSSVHSDSTEDDIFKPVTPKKTSSTEENSRKRITRSFIKQSSSIKKELKTSSKEKDLKRKRKKELSTQKNVASWCESISRPESPEILRQNSCSSVESQTPNRDFKLAPGRALEGIKLDISNNFGFSSPEMATIPEEPAQKRIRKSVDDADIKGLLEGILPKSKDVCRNKNITNNMSDTGVYPLAPNNTPVSPVIEQKEKSEMKEQNSYITDASDKDETGAPFSPRQSTMIDDMASKTLPSLPQFSYVSEQLEESFINEDTVRLSGIEREETSKESVKISPLIKSSLNTRLQLSVEDDSPPHEGFLIPSQPWTPPQVDSDSENDITHEEILHKPPVENLDQTLRLNELKSALVTSSDEDKGNNQGSPELFSLEPNCPLVNHGTQAFSLHESGGKHSSNTPSEPSSLENNQTVNKIKHFSKEELVEYKEKVCNILVNQENICNKKDPESKTKTAQLLNKVLDKYEQSENFEGASQLTPTSHQNPLETPEVSQRRLFLNMDEIDISGLDPPSPITPTRRRMLMQQMDEFRTHIQVSYTRSMALWENVMQILGDKKN